MKLVFLLEEKSTKVLLDQLLPRILPPGTDFQTIPHEGKSDLKKSLQIKLEKWNEPDVRFVVIQDQDSNDCKKLKTELKTICDHSGKEVLVRIACHEMEAWYFGDLNAVSQAYGKGLTNLSQKRKYRDPDAIVSPKQELRKLIPEHEQIAGARKIAPYMDINNNRSGSFNMLLSGLRKITEQQKTASECEP